MDKLMKHFFALILLLVTAASEAQSEIDALPEDGSQDNSTRGKIGKSSDLLDREAKISEQESEDGYQPIKRIDETPVNVRDAQNFPNNI